MIDTKGELKKVIKGSSYRVRLWIKEIRAPFFTATIVPVTFGSALAWYNTSSFSWAKFCLTLIGAIFVHAGTNMANDYFDHISGCDEANQNPTPFSGGSRMIQNGLIKPRHVLYASLIAFTIGGSIGLYLNYLSEGNVILILGLIGIFLGFFYSAEPLRIGYKLLGEISTGIGFGPLMVIGSYYVQSPHLRIDTALTSIPISILITSVLYINEFHDYSSDMLVGKKTLVVVLGKRKAMHVYQVMLASSYLSIIGLTLFGILPVLCLITIFSLPLAIKAVVIVKDNFNKPKELIPASSTTVKLHLITGMLLTLGIAMDKVIK